jgi:hypothetical protein
MEEVSRTMEGSSLSEKPANFWPRLRATAKLLGAEPKQAEEADTDSTADGLVDTRVFLQGGDSVAKNIKRLRRYFSEGLRLCVLFEEEEKFAAFSRKGTPVVQGLVQSVSDCNQKVTLATEDGRLYTEQLTCSKVWWCLPYWVGAEKQISDSAQMRMGFYFLAEPDQRFKVVLVNHADLNYNIDLSLDEVVASIG